ncbi:MAG: NUDIX hydrolase [Solirubrobacteraceae bacterium]
MEGERGEPFEPLDTGAEPVEPRQAATVIVLRGGAEGLEVLLVRRNPRQRFMGGAWVFPGGAVDAADGDDHLAHRAAGVREVAEEAGVALPGTDALLPYSRWITPKQVAVRFDTHFFLARAPDGATPEVDGAECVDWGWYRPADALATHRRDELALAFPTLRTLEGLAGFASADALLAWAPGRAVEPIEPKVVVEGEVARVLLPGDHGYAE